MSAMGRRFDPSEVRPDTGAGPSDTELAQAMLAARELESLSARDAAGPTVGFEDRVMVAIASEAAPRLIVRPGHSVRGGLPAAFLASVRDAWRIAVGGGRPLVIRAQAVAFVLLVTLAFGSISVFAAVGASNLLAGPSLSPNTPAPTVSPDPASSPSPTGLKSPSPTPPPAAVETMPPGVSVEPGTTAEPTDAAEPTETGGTGAHDTAKPTKTPRPTETAEPNETNEPGETDEPKESDDGGGHGAGGGDDEGGGD